MARGKSVGPLMALATQIAALSLEERGFVTMAVSELSPERKRRRRRKGKGEYEDAETEAPVKKAKRTKKVKKAKKEKKLIAGTDTEDE